MKRKLARVQSSRTLLGALAVSLLSCSADSTKPRTRATPAFLEIVSGPTRGVVGTQLPAPVVVRVLDSTRKPMSGQPVTFRVTIGGGSLIGASDTTDATGQARALWTLGTVAEVKQSLEAAAVDVGNASPVLATFDATAAPGAPAALDLVEGDNQAAATASAVRVPPAAVVHDSFGNVVPAVAVTFAVVSGGGTIALTTVQTNASGVATEPSWVLGSSPGANSLSASVVNVAPVTFRATALRTSKDVTVDVVAPATAELVGDTISIAANITSAFTLTSVTAKLGAAQTTLTKSAAATQYSGTLILSGVSFGQGLMLEVTAAAVNGAVTQVDVPLVHDTRPRILLSSPATGSVARPQIDFAATCVDDDPAGCRSLVVSVSGSSVEIASATSALSGSADLSGWNGRVVDLLFLATDSRGRTSSAVRTVYVESSTHLTPLVSVDGPAVLDFRAGRAAYVRTSDSLLVVRAASGATEVIGVPRPQVTAPPPHLYRFGVLVAGQAPGSAYPNLYDWRSGSYATFALLNDATMLESNLGYAVFGLGGSESTGTTLYRRDLAAGSNTIIASGVGTIHNSVAPNGDVAFWSLDRQVRRWHDAVLTQLTRDTVLTNRYPVTDGVNVVYVKTTPCCDNQQYSIALNDGTSETVLRPAGAMPAEQHRDYEVNAGWTAFTSPDATSILQVWRRSPTGTVAQATRFPGTTSIEALGPDGTVIILNGVRRYAIAPDGTAVDVGGQNGTALWRDDQFVLLLGNTVFKLTP